MYEYVTYTKPDLKRMLRQRSLRVSGTKTELITRLTEYDVDHAFPFLKLPVEIRIEIYKYAAASDDIPPKFTTKSALESQKPSPHAYVGNLRAYLDDLWNQKSIAQPGLFHTCSQIYHESRVFFYRHHYFKFLLRQEDNRAMSRQKKKRQHTCLERWCRWFTAIGADMQKQIQTIEFGLTCRAFACQDYTRFIEDLHAKLSDRATVIYRGTRIDSLKENMVLWRLADGFQDKITMRVPHLEYPVRPVGQRTYREDDPGPTLTFGPGAGWFGRSLGGTSA